jgi:large subunit ribosomal protein L20
MARVKRAQIKKTRTKKLFARASGFFLSRGKLRRQAEEAVMHARADAYRGRKEKKRQFRAMWIVRIGAALGPHGMSYSQFIHGLAVANIQLNRKQLSELAIHDAEAFATVVGQARQALGL